MERKRAEASSDPLEAVFQECLHAVLVARGTLTVERAEAVLLGLKRAMEEPKP